MMLSMTAAIRAASSAVSLLSTGHNSYKLLTPYKRDDIDGPLYSRSAGNWWAARQARAEAVAELALWLMGYDTANFYTARETTIKGMIKVGMETLPRKEIV
jgi:hypothetical protein